MYRRPLVLIAWAAIALALPAGVAAHAELETVFPADGTTVTEAPTEIVMTFTEALDPAKSSIVLAEVGNPPQLSGGKVSANDPKRMTLAIPELAAGVYEIRWTSTSAEDGDIARGTTHFTYAPTPPSPTDEASPSPSSSASPSASIASPSASTSPAPSPSGSTTPTASGTDVLLPIIAALVVIALFAAWLMRNRSRGRA
jgi:methionine-rich copper-binding protein CopC